MRTTRKRWCPPLALLIALPLTGCSGSEAGSDDHPSTQDAASGADAGDERSDDGGPGGDAGGGDSGGGDHDAAGDEAASEAGGGSDGGDDACVPESDPSFCARLGFDCDTVATADNCGNPRSVDCGACTGGAVCSANTCATVTRVTAGQLHTCALMTNHRVHCWGMGGYGQLGDGTFDDQHLTHLVPNLSDVVGVASGFNGTCALLGDATLRCWGGFMSGNVVSPTAIALSNVAEAALNQLDFCARLTDGTVRCWSKMTDVPAAVPGAAQVTQVAVGRGHACALLQDGTVACWGENDRGQLGDGTKVPRDTPLVVPGLTDVKEIALAVDESCARLASGRVSCWGDNAKGQLGDDTQTSRATPADVKDLTDATQLAGGGTGVLTFDSTYCALHADATVSCWGSLAKSAKPAAVTGLAGVEQVAVGGHHVCAKVAGGTVRCWGSNQYGQLGDGTTVSRDTP